MRSVFQFAENKKLLGGIPKYQDILTQIQKHYVFNVNLVWKITDLRTTLTVKSLQPSLTPKLTTDLLHGNSLGLGHF